MCKVFFTAGITDEVRPNFIKFVHRMAAIMSPGNTDGLGYAAVNKDGDLFAERWVNNQEAFRLNDNGYADKFVVSMLSKALKNKNITLENRYNKYGVPDLSTATAITLHTRMATSPKSMENTHPFIDNDTSLIHNGVITNTKEFAFKLSTCDSEAILISYLRSGTNILPEAMDDAAKDLVGYYACGVFARDANGSRVLDIFKANNNNLSITFVYELKTWVMGSLGENITRACAELGFSHGTVYDIDDGYLLRYEPNTGKLISDTPFKVSDSFRNTYWHNNFNRGHYEHNKNERDVNKIITLPAKEHLTKEQEEFYNRKPNILLLHEREAQELLVNEYYGG